MTFLSYRIDHSIVEELGKVMLEGEVILINVDEEIFKNSWEIFKEKMNIGLSFTDCSNLVIMRTYGIENIATFDRGFNKISDIKVLN
jgi:predicted nucleic acid-binding protein